MKMQKSDFIKFLKRAPCNNQRTFALQRIFQDPENIELFAEFFFPHVMTSKTPAFHKEIYDVLFKNSNDALAAPRGHAKSTITGLIFLIFNIVNRREPYIVYMSQNHSKTVQFLDPIRTEFKTNERLRLVYGDLTPKLVSGEDGRDREDCFDVNKCRIEAVSFEKNIRGFKFNNIRPTLIIGDDIEDDVRVMNPELRDKDSNKLNKVVIPSLDINGRFKMIGTVLHINGLLMSKIRQYDGKIFKACNHDYTDILWEDRFTKDKLQQIKKDIGSVAFEQEYLNNPINTTNSLIKREWIQRCFDEEISYADFTSNTNPKIQIHFKTLGVDFAFSDRITADRSAYVGLGRVGSQYIVTSCDTSKGMSVTEQMNTIETLHQIHKYDQIGLEENSIKAVSKDLNKYNLPLTLFWTAASDPAVRKKSDYDYFGKRHTVGKIQMLLRLGTAFENEEIVLPYKTERDKQITEELASECLSYALSDGKLVESSVHPDIPIALGYALELQTNNNAIFDFGDDSIAS